MAKMNNETRTNIINICKDTGFSISLKATGIDLYDKVLAFKSNRFPSTIYIDRNIGISTSGDINYLKIALHPNDFKESAINSEEGIEENLNNITKVNIHSSSNYKGFPVYERNAEPCAKCYKVSGLIALGKLLSSLL